MLDSGNGFFNILYTAIVAIAGALAKEINDKAKDKESFPVFVSEVILHGFSGWIGALLAIKYTNSMDILFLRDCIYLTNMEPRKIDSITI